MTSLVVTGRNVAKWVRKLHAEEEGTEVLQIVMVLALMAMVLTGVGGIAGMGGDGKPTGQKGSIFTWVTDALGGLFGDSGSGALGGILSGIGGLF